MAAHAAPVSTSPSPGTPAGWCSGDVTVKSASDWRYHSYCTAWSGSITLQGTGVDDTVVATLANLRSISGNLTFTNTRVVAPAMPYLQTIGGGLYLIGNTTLSSLGSGKTGGFPSLRSVGTSPLADADLEIDYAPKLTSLAGFPILTEVWGGIRIDQVEHTDFSGFAPLLTTINGELRLEMNHSQTSVDGLPSGVTTVGGNLQIDDCNSLTSLAGFANVTSIGGNLHVGKNDVLTHLSGLESVTSVGGIHLEDNDLLDDVSALAGIATCDGELLIDGNPSLASLSGLGFTKVAGKLRIANTALTTLNGLENLERVGTDMKIADNANLTTLAALANLERIGSTSSASDALWITGNAALTELGLDAVASGWTDHLEVGDNPLLCESLAEVLATDLGLDPTDPSACDLYDNLVCD